jgi:hypothetical protein
MAEGAMAFPGVTFKFAKGAEQLAHDWSFSDQYQCTCASMIPRKVPTANARDIVSVGLCKQIAERFHAGRMGFRPILTFGEMSVVICHAVQPIANGLVGL